MGDFLAKASTMLVQRILGLERCGRFRVSLRRNRGKRQDMDMSLRGKALQKQGQQREQGYQPGGGWILPGDVARGFHADAFSQIHAPPYSRGQR